MASSGSADHLPERDRASRRPTRKVPAAGVGSRPAGGWGCQRPDFMIPGRLARGLGLFCASVHKKIPRCGEGSRHFAFRQLPSIILIVAVLAALSFGFLRTLD